jgi:ribosomal protein L7/L12
LSWLRRKHDSPNLRPARPAPVRGPFPAGPPGDQFDVFLMAAGDKKIQVIKVIRECSRYGLKESKDLVDASDRGPVAILTRLARYDADRVAAALTAVGANVAVGPSAASGGPDWDAQPGRRSAAACPAAACPADQSGDQFVVVLTAAGDKKIQVIKVIREYTGYGLKESKDLVDASAYGPVPLTPGLPISDANQVAAALTRAGATVTVTVSPSAGPSALDWP